MNNQKGIVWIPILIMIVSVAAFTTMGVLIWNKNKNQDSTYLVDLSKPAVQHVVKTVQKTGLTNFTSEDLGITFAYSPSLGPVKTQTLTPNQGTEAGKKIKVEFTGSGTTTFGTAIQIISTSKDFSAGGENWLGEVLSKEAEKYGFVGLCNGHDAWLNDVQSCSVNSSGDQITMVLAIRSLDGKDILQFAKLVALKTQKPEFPVVGLVVFLPKMNEPTIVLDDTTTITKKVTQIITAGDHPENNLLEFNSMLATLRYNDESANRKTYTNTANKYSFQYHSPYTIRAGATDSDVVLDCGVETECRDEVAVSATPTSLTAWKATFSEGSNNVWTDTTVDGQSALRVDTNEFGLSYVGVINNNRLYVISGNALLDHGLLSTFQFTPHTIEVQKIQFRQMITFRWL